VDWTRQSLEIARKLAAQQHFDLAHHLTYSSWRIPSPLWKLDLPFIWGPVGGAAAYPIHLLGKLAIRSAVFELARGLSNLHASYSRSLKQCVSGSNAVVASNNETFDKLLALRGTSDGMHLLFPTFFTDQQIAMFRCDPAKKTTSDPIRLFAGGNIIGSKGLIFALEALRTAAQRGIKWRLVVGGYGPEVPFLKKRARALGIEAWIEFHMGFSGVEYFNKLKNSHVFILPSFRENAGITMLEAMLAGCVPVIVDASAQAAVVNERCGFKIPVGCADAITKGLADALDFLARNPQRRIEMGRNASALVEHTFSEKAYVQKMREIYEEAISRRSSRSSP
jgi:glycosyltransferase involved in cell wall biosynthesis